MELTDNKHVNLTAYEDVELLTNFTEARFQSYCDDKLASCDKHITFIKERCITTQWSGRVCEIGSGNSKLLYKLEKEGLVTEALGIEISQSRYDFAEKFRLYIESVKVTNINKNLFDIKPLSNLDLIMGVDIVLQLIAPISQSAQSDTLKWCYDSLSDGGFLILELWDFKNVKEQLELCNGQLNTWKEFPDSDPFEYILCDVTVDSTNDLVWNKTFLKRNSNERSCFKNILRPYSRETITQLLTNMGFRSIQIFDSWCVGAAVDDHGEYIVLAQK
ncbi:class I SAM-dependent methyltransferase [Algibacillus agarilyticus]|uniref:class I SAM-dependent methyltransferase n=1 Tax=Algibacillus agarilyticus TaxID=2234133 RepID=UPI000DD0648D|nr:class I SAM-dependent methyltransferase [Algibacillus agarilyticus]